MDYDRFCKKCEHYKFSLDEGIVCGLTNLKPSFGEECHYFVLNPSKENMVTSSERSRYSNLGIGGWLLFLCLSLTVFSPIMTLFTFLSGYEEILSLSASNPEFKDLLVVDSILSIALMVFSIIAGINLWRINPKAVQFAKMYLLAFLGYSLISSLMPFMIDLPDNTQSFVWIESIKDGVLSLTYFVIWFLYLSKSRRVKETYDMLTLPKNFFSVRIFLHLFNFEKFGINYYAGFGFLIASILSILIWAALLILFNPGVFSGRTSFSGLMPSHLYFIINFISQFILAYFFLLICSKLNKNMILMLSWGLIMVVISVIKRVILHTLQTDNEAQLEILKVDSILWPIIFGVLFMAGLIYSVKIWGPKLWAFTLGLSIANLIIGLAQYIYYVPADQSTIKDWIQIFVTSGVEGFVYAIFIYLGLTLHFKNKEPNPYHEFFSKIEL